MHRTPLIYAANCTKCSDNGQTFPANPIAGHHVIFGRAMAGTDGKFLQYRYYRQPPGFAEHKGENQ